MPAEAALGRLKVLLLQIRDEPEVERQEQDCFIHFSGLAPEQFTFRNIVERPDVVPRDVEGFWTKDELARIEQIEVTQEVDRFWEARVTTAMCLDANGQWQHRPDEVGAAFTRMRVELDPGNGRFVPLIDGAISNLESKLDSQPGRSTVTSIPSRTVASNPAA